MKKIIKYTGEKTFMFPSGAIATKEEVLIQFPAALMFTHVVETDEAEEVMWALENLSALRTQFGIDSSLTEEEAIAAIQEIINTPEPENTEVTAEERIAAALEYQVMASLPDEETSDTTAIESEVTV
ncbi:MAG: hypothetical protein J6A19_14685 [Oscillospiraceae bacterium]|nr:hypothetical protein [Oscillospiraceae bacterium]